MSRTASPFAVLGIDAAWTERNPSGVALIEVHFGRAAAVAAAPGYASFCSDRVDWTTRQDGGLCDAGRLLDAARARTALPIRCVAVDMALSRTPIVGRRAADNLTSAAFARQWCGTHSPSPERPGRVSEELVAGFRARGYELAVHGEPLPAHPLVEVHPHGALVRLLREEKRLPYKLGRLAQYYPDQTREQRRARLFATWRRIIDALDAEVTGAGRLLPPDFETFTGARLKAVEDTLDAILCAWIGAEVMRGRGEAFGDGTAAIWVPRSELTVTTSS